MKSKLFATSSIFALALSGVILTHPTLSFSEEAAMEAANMEATDMGEGGTVEVDNKTCPVCGMAIEEGKAHKVEYNGKIYNLCSAGEEAAFLKDADTLISKMEGTPEMGIEQPGVDVPGQQ